MSDLSWYGVGVGLILLVGGLMGWIVPARMQAAMRSFPRHRVAAIMLTVVNVIWVTWLLIETPLGRFESWKPALYVLSPATLLAVIFFMDELLAPRMLAGFLLLLAVPILDAARWHESPWRLILTTLVYIWIVWSMLVMLSPYRFRHTVEWCEEDGRQRIVTGVFAVVGAALLVMGFFIY